MVTSFDVMDVSLGLRSVEMPLCSTDLSILELTLMCPPKRSVGRYSRGHLGGMMGGGVSCCVGTLGV